MPESGPSGSERGVRGDPHPYRATNAQSASSVKRLMPGQIRMSNRDSIRINGSDRQTPKAAFRQHSPASAKRPISDIQAIGARS
jgi:hypothetical protein